MGEVALPLELLERIADALERLAPPSTTVDVAGAARLLHTNAKGIYDRRRTGRMPTPISKRPLVWRTADVLAMRE